MAKKTTVKITGTDKARDSALKFINQQTKDTEFLKKIGQESVDQIRKAVQSLQPEYKQPALKESTIEARKLLSKNNGEGDFFKPPRSNLTMSGQLLKSLSYKINSTLSEIAIYLKNDRFRLFPLSKAETKQAYNEIIDKDNNATNSKRKDPKDKARIAGIFLASKPQKDKTNNEIKDDLEKRGRKFFFVSDKINTLLENLITKELRRKLSIYNRINRKLK